MMKFEYTHSSSPNFRTSMEIDEDSTLYEVVEAFEDFLKSCGFQIEGHIEYIENELAIERSFNHGSAKL